LNKVTAASVAKYGKNTNVWQLRRYHWHRAVQNLKLLFLSCVIQPKLTTVDWNTL
jgi:hypothetical protein